MTYNICPQHIPLLAENRLWGLRDQETHQNLPWMGMTGEEGSKSGTGAENKLNLLRSPQWLIFGCVILVLDMHLTLMDHNSILSPILFPSGT